ncbi:syntaxin-11-like [Kryptolebias marmoratus]|uniref:syntaxin-11-like n=1 Tax=Kryptolebias marmoratus TaxID=37003 RepID=UPI0007F8BC7F|nr:syntaxin-11-like [Kryptolebias marmoratus]
MRDMLVRLKTINEEQEGSVTEHSKHEFDEHNGTLLRQAVIFESSSPLDVILKEAQTIRKEIALLCSEVTRLNANNERYATTVSCLSLLKKDSDAIARRIRHRGESVYAHLQALGNKSKQLEEEEGANSAVCRIAQTQYSTLTHAFQAAMNDYNKAEEKERKICRKRIQRQASILGKDISDEQLDELVDKGGEGWTELSQDFHPHGIGSCRMAMCDIKGRHKELVELEARLKEVHELFLQMATLVEEQGSVLNNIEVNVCRTAGYIEKFNDNVKRAIQYKKKNPFLQCCPCLPCWGQSSFF